MSFFSTNDDSALEALASLGVGMIEADASASVTSLNRFARKMTGWTPVAAKGQPVERVFRLADDGSGGRRNWMQRFENEVPSGPEREDGILVRRDGQRFPIEYSLARVNRPGGQSGGIIIAFIDVSEKHLMAHHLERVANLDLLTGLLNRKAFTEHLASALEGCSETDEEHVVCFIDIDQFKLVNDTCGHDAGDDLIQWVAALMRESAGERDTVARFGGDEFVVLLVRSTIDQGLLFIEEVQRRMREFSFTWGDKSFQITAAAGLTRVTAGEMTTSRILSAVDHACYLAKDKGRGGVRVFDLSDKEASGRFDEMNIVARIHRSLRDGSAELFAQEIQPLTEPKLGLQMEVLLRFRDKDGQLRDPGATIGATERYGLMPSVDRWVIHNALSQLSELGRDGLSRIEVCFINLSGLSLQDDGVLDFIRNELSDSGVPPNKIGFEITETAAVQNLQQAQWFIQELGSIGCRLSLDDFGTGAASYSYLKSLPVQYLKIDGGFVEAITSSPLDLAMVESINQIAQVLGIGTVAESVSSEELMTKIRAMGVDHAQGFWISRPQPLADICRRILNT